MKAINLFLVLIVCASLLVEKSACRMFKPLIEGSEDRGSGITDQQLNFIKARIIQVANMAGKYPEKNADSLQKVISLGLTGVWGVFIMERTKDAQNNVGINVGQPLDNKYWQGEQFGPFQWTYAVWKQRN